jgi:LCP family protein required for cell wall assembly
MGKHSRGGLFPGGGRDAERSSRIPAERVLSTESSQPLENATARPGVESAPARLMTERNRRRNRTKRIVLAVLGVLGVMLIAGAAMAFAWVQNLQSTMKPEELTEVDRKTLEITLAKSEPGEPFNVLMLGTDARPEEKVFRTDTIIVAHVNPQTKKIWMLSIPRDTKVLIPGHGYSKINNAHFFGGIPLTVKTVKGFTGLEIDHYMRVNFKGFQNAVDEMGGVWVDVPKAINDKQAASQSVHQRAYKISAGWQKLDGEHALTFVRSRAGFRDQDFSRISDQQIFFRAMAEQLAHKTDAAMMVRVVNAVAPHVKTDMQIMEMMNTALALKGAGAKSVFTATVSGEWVAPYIVPNESKLDTLVSNMKREQPFAKSANVATVVNPSGATSTGSAPATRTAPSGVKPSSVKITVRNGAGVSGYAAQAASILKAKGFKVKDVGNADQSVYSKTLVVYKTNKAAAEAVAATLMPGTKVVKNKGRYTSKTEILVVIGKDWDMSKIPAATVTTR